jgi:hypothetical protein
VVRRATHARATQRQWKPQLQPCPFREEYAYTVGQRPIHLAVEDIDGLPRERRRHRTQQVNHSAERGTQPDEHVDHLRVVERRQRAERVLDGLRGKCGDEVGAEGLIANGPAQQLEPIAEASTSS